MSAGRRLALNPPKLGDFRLGIFLDLPHVIIAYFNPLHYNNYTIIVHEIGCSSKDFAMDRGRDSPPPPNPL